MLDRIAWLSEACVLILRLTPIERAKPFFFFFRKKKISMKIAIIRITTSPHGLYVLGYMRVTKDYTKSCDKVT